MGTAVRIFFWALLGAFFLYVYLTLPIYEYENSNTDPGFFTVDDTVEVKLPLIEGDLRYKRLEALDAVPLIINTDTIFWDAKILEINYDIKARKRKSTSHRVGRSIINISEFKDRGPGGKRSIRLVIPDDTRLIGQRLFWNLWFENDEQPHQISFKIFDIENHDEFVLMKTIRITSLVLAILSILMLMGVTLGRTGMAKIMISRRLRKK